MSGAFAFDPWAGAAETSKMEAQGVPPAKPAKPANPAPQDGTGGPFSSFSSFSSPDPTKLKNALSDHDAAEAEAKAMAQHYAAPAEPDLPQPDPMLRGLLAAAAKRPTAWADPTALPSVGAYCGCCDGRRWWSDPAGWRCQTCHPPPPGLPGIVERRT